MEPLEKKQIEYRHNCQLLPENDIPIPIVLAANQNYVLILHVCIQSIVQHAVSRKLYELYIFHTDIEPQSQKLIQKLYTDVHIAIKFVNVKSYVSGYTLEAKQHITTETFYRFLILEILQDYPKVVYLDCDTIVCYDIAHLYDTEMGDNLVAAAKDPDFAGQCNKPDSEMLAYCQEVLGLENPFTYFQAGVLVLNVAQLNKTVSVTQLLQMADTGIYRFSDQDILNVVCKGKVTYLDMAWNVLFDCDHSRWRDVIQFAPKYIVESYQQAREEPFLIHYAGFLKPWMRLGEDFGYEFWVIARKTVFYEQLYGEMLLQMMEQRMIQEREQASKLESSQENIQMQEQDNMEQQHLSEEEDKQCALNWKGKILVCVKEIAKAILPEGSWMWKCAVRVYLWMTSVRR